MQSFAVLTLLAALSNLVNAIPNPRNLGHFRYHGQHIGVAVKDRSIMDGKCGSDAGSCGPGYCCSQWGYCGQSQDYCGAGCQAAFGGCSSGTADNTPVVSASSAVRQDVHTASISALASAYTGPLTSTFLAIPLSTTSTIYAAPTSSASSPPPPPASSSSQGGSGSGNVYKMYTGDGTNGWPTLSDWASFDSIWNANLRILEISCAAFNAADNSDDEIQDIKSAIQSTASSSGVDARFILATVMQESKGCVRVPTTANGVTNPGLMQSHDGTGTCNSNGAVSNPCPQSEVQQMITDGTTGTPSGDGLQQLLAGGTDALSYYKAARKYNSGSVDPSGDLGKGVATHCYASDIANRLMGWVDASSTCTLD